jgi:hypothetical protein
VVPYVAVDGGDSTARDTFGRPLALTDASRYRDSNPFGNSSA